MARSTNIVGRIIRNVTKYDKSFNESNLTLLYDELNEAQKDLFTRVLVEKSFEITMATDQEDYPLSSIGSAGDIIRDVITFIKPDAWKSEILFTPKREWDMVRKSETLSTQPLYYSIFEKTLKLYPTSQADGETLILWVHLKQPTSLIAAAVEPEIPAMWDKALEWFTTAQFVDPNTSNYYMQKYLAEIEEKGATDFLNNTNTQIGEAY